MKLTPELTDLIAKYIHIIETSGLDAADALAFRAEHADRPAIDGLLATIYGSFASHAGDTAALVGAYTDAIIVHGPGSAQAEALRRIHRGNVRFLSLADIADEIHAKLTADARADAKSITIVGLFHPNGQPRRFVASIREHGTAWTGAMDYWPLTDARERPIQLAEVAFDTRLGNRLAFVLPGIAPGQTDYRFDLIRAGAPDECMGHCTISGATPDVVPVAVTLTAFRPSWIERDGLEKAVGPAKAAR